MRDSTAEVARARINAAVREELGDLQPWVRAWVRAHLIEPRPITLCTNPDTGAHSQFWLVTDHVGLDDSAMRIVYDEAGFGLETTLDDGVAYLARRTRSLREAVDSL